MTGAGRRVALAAGLLLVAGAAGAADPYGGLDTFARVLAEVERSALAPVVPERLVHAALEAMVATLDPHSAFYPPEAVAAARDAEAGVYVGLGVDGEPAGCGFRVRGVVAGGPAAAGGVLPGDCLVSADGVPLAGRPEADARARFDRPEGTVVTLAVEGPGGRREVVALARRVRPPAAVATPMGGGVLHLRVTSFRPDAAAEAARLVEAAAPRALVLDLRGNPGGELAEGVAFADRFLADGTVVTTEGRGPGASGRWEADPAAWTFPVVVLVDGRTASAAELVAGALQARGRARLVGEPTFGKSTVQARHPLPDGSLLKLSHARWRLPDGRSPEEGAGLRPDVAVPGARPAGLAGLRSRLQTVPGLHDADRAALLAEVDALAPPASAPTDDRALAAARALLGG